MQRGANLEPGFIIARLPLRPGGGQRSGRHGRVGRQGVDVGLDRRIAGGDLALVRVEELEVLVLSSPHSRAPYPSGDVVELKFLD